MGYGSCAASTVTHVDATLLACDSKIRVKEVSEPAQWPAEGTNPSRKFGLYCP